MTFPTRLAIFDLDGTLVDSVRDLVPALNHTVAQAGVPPTSLDDVGHVVGQGALKMIERAFALHGHELEPGGTQHLHLFEQFLARYEAHIADETVFFPGALTVLDQLKQESWKIAICTNKLESLARILLEELGEHNRFDVITGGDTFDVKKPDPAHLVKTAKLAGVEASNCIMVGDSVNDIEAAQAANIPVIAVDFGYTDVPVLELNPDIMISHYDEFMGALGSLEYVNEKRIQRQQSA